MKKITLENGKSYTIGFDFATLLEFEQHTGGPLDLNTLTDFSASGTFLNLFYSVLKSFNEDVPSFKEFTHELSLNDFKLLSNEVGAALNKFYNIPEIAESHVSEPEDNEETEHPNE